MTRSLLNYSRAITLLKASVDTTDLASVLEIGGGYVTVVIQGDVGSVKASVDAGAEAAGDEDARVKVGGAAEGRVDRGKCSPRRREGFPGRQ